MRVLVVLAALLLVACGSDPLADEPREREAVVVTAESTRVVSRLEHGRAQAVLDVRARRGDAFVLVESEPLWFRVRGPSGSVRWVERSHARVEKVPLRLPEAESARQAIHAELAAAEVEAQQRADLTMPAHSLEKQVVEAQRVHKDAGMLRVMHRHDLSAFAVEAIAREGAEKGWR